MIKKRIQNCDKNIVGKGRSMDLVNGRPETSDGRLDKEIRVYDFLDQLGINYQRVDHVAVMTMEACKEVDEIMGKETAICKNLFLCNRQETDFYLLLLPEYKRFQTKCVSSQLGSARLSFAKEDYMKHYLDVTPGSVSIMGLMNDTQKKVQLLIDVDVLKYKYFGCHPCINTSSLKIKMDDLRNEIIPALDHEPVYLKL